MKSPAETLFDIGYTQLTNAQYQAAFSTFVKVLASHKASQAELAKGVVLSQEQQREEEAITAKYQYYYAFACSAYVTVAHGKKELYQEAIQYFDLVISLEQTLPEKKHSVNACYHTALIYRELGKPEEAIIWIRQALIFKPDDGIFNELLANLIKKQEPLKAIAHYESALLKFKNSFEHKDILLTTYENLAQLYMSQNTEKTDKLAIDNYIKACEMSQGTARIPYLIQLAKIEQRNKKYDNAFNYCKACKKILKAEKDKGNYVNPEHHLLIVSVLKDLQKSIQDPNPVIQKNITYHLSAAQHIQTYSMPDESNTQEYNDGLIKLYYYTYLFDRETFKGTPEVDSYPGTNAIYNFKKILKKDSNNIKAHYYLGYIYFQMDRYLDAIKHYGKVLSLNNTFALAHERVYELLTNEKFSVPPKSLTIATVLELVKHQPDIHKKTQVLKCILDINSPLGNYCLFLEEMDKDTIYSVIKMMPDRNDRIKYLELSTEEVANNPLAKRCQQKRQLKSGLSGSTLEDMKADLRTLTHYRDFLALCKLAAAEPEKQFFVLELNVCPIRKFELFKSKPDLVKVGHIIRQFNWQGSNTKSGFHKTYCDFINKLDTKDLLTAIFERQIIGANDLNCSTFKEILWSCLDINMPLGQKLMVDGNKKILWEIIKALPETNPLEQGEKAELLEQIIYGNDMLEKNIDVDVDESLLKLAPSEQRLFEIFHQAADLFGTVSEEKGTKKEMIDMLRRLVPTKAFKKDISVNDDFVLVLPKIN